MIKATILFKLVILCLLCTPAYSQEIPFGSSIEHGKVCKTGDEDKPVKTVRGRVVDRENQALEYVNIGIERKNFGTMSFRNGLFELDIPYKYRNDTLTFSHVGFVQERMPIANIDGFRTIELYENVNVLGEVLITANRPKIKQIGIKSYSRMIGGRALHSERATMMKPGKLPLKVEKLNIAFNWVDQREDSVYFRINFYSVTDSMPGNNISGQNIIVKCPIKQGWNEFDLRPFNIVMTENFFAGIEWLPDLDKKSDRHFLYGGVMLRPRSFFGRDTRFGEWKKIPGFALSMNLQVLYY